ncbi:unnamed protein product [Protopolystoma xenopodis]|uniref:Uncharacterized protein n=1 Tax=Protopolystoma xenopodis TaxID=117903 RepID=A0A448XM96_9PLAT|nr:unnamed protein product [Protopolystoma xenopodis]
MIKRFVQFDPTRRRCWIPLSNLSLGFNTIFWLTSSPTQPFWTPVKTGSAFVCPVAHIVRADAKCDWLFHKSSEITLLGGLSFRMNVHKEEIATSIPREDDD